MENGGNAINTIVHYPTCCLISIKVWGSSSLSSTLQSYQLITTPHSQNVHPYTPQSPNPHPNLSNLSNLTSIEGRCKHRSALNDLLHAFAITNLVFTNILILSYRKPQKNRRGHSACGIHL